MSIITDRRQPAGPVHHARTLRIGSLCSGYGGLDLAVEQFFNARTVWFSEFEEAPSRILAHHWPTVPNLGDMTQIDWATVPPVDIVTGGTPCQDLSGAGKRRGMTEGTRSNLWVQMRECIAVLKPSIVTWENVRGAYSARADSDVESEPGLLGSFGPDRPALRALGRVLGDLSELGFDAEVVPVRASDVGAPHGRFRVFVVAVAQDAGCLLGGARWDASAGEAEGGRASAFPGGSGGARAATAWDSLEDQSPFWVTEKGVDYWPAISRWAAVLGRNSPSPTIPDGKDGRHRLNPRFAEWMMGCDDGWLSDPKIWAGTGWSTSKVRNAILKAAGNGVVTRQAFAALTVGWARFADLGLL